MGLFDRFRRTSAGQTRQSASADEKHLKEWAAARRGVEGFLEPQTTVSSVTLLLVAHDGEWTRRRVPSVRWAHDFCNRLGIPSYDAAVVGVPSRMREFNRRQNQKKKGNNFY
jgi:hypothetical protein